MAGLSRRPARDPDAFEQDSDRYTAAPNDVLAPFRGSWMLDGTTSSWTA
jgi:hypothetical protein